MFYKLSVSTQTEWSETCLGPGWILKPLKQPVWSGVTGSSLIVFVALPEPRLGLT